MHEDTGEVREYSKIPDGKKKNWSDPFHKGDIVEVKGLKFKISGWRSNGRLFLKLVKGGRKHEGFGTTGVDKQLPETSLVTIEKAFLEVDKRFGVIPTEIMMKPEFYKKFRKECSDGAPVGPHTVIADGVNIPTVLGMSVVIDPTLDKDWRLVFEKDCPGEGPCVYEAENGSCPPECLSDPTKIRRRKGDPSGE